LAPSVGEVLGGMTQGGTIPRIVLTDGDPDPLQSLREEIERRLSSNWRDVRLRLLPTEVEHGSIMGIGLTCVKLYNELNYEKRQAYFKGELTRDKMYEIDRRYYYKASYHLTSRRFHHQVIGRIGLLVRRIYIHKER
jgi:hypothetical protein